MFVIDIHCHTLEYSACAKASAAQMIGAAHDAGLDGLIITDHHTVFPMDRLRTIAREVGARDLVILSGFEGATYVGGAFYGDFLCYGADGVKDGCGPEEFIERVHQAGGVVVSAHPCRSGSGPREGVLALGVDGVEVRNGNTPYFENNEASEIAERGGLAQLGGSDAHRPECVAECVTVLERPIATMEEFIAELRAGRVRAALGYQALSAEAPRGLR